MGCSCAEGVVVTVICTDPTPYLSDPADRGLIALCERAVVPTDIDSAALVFAHTGSEAVDASIATEAAGRGVFCHALVVDASKISRGRAMAQSVINSHLISHALAGKNVVRLKGGDGFVFGRGGEEVDECVLAGITVNVIPGVSSAIAAPAVAMTPATHRGLTQGFTVISGHVIADGSLSSQRVVLSTLDAIAAAARAGGIGPPATAVIGAVAGFVPGRTANLPAVELNVR
jgi:siroheme synthase